MRIVLADPPALERHYDNSYPNLGILYVAGYLLDRFKDLSWIHYLESFEDLHSHVDFVKTKNPEIYGISFTSKTARLAYITINAVKAASPDTFIVAGGAHPTAMPQEVLKNSNADVCVIGEGEETFLEIAEKVATRDYDWSKVAGVAYRSSEGDIFNGPRPFIRELDGIPFPARDLIANPSRYHGNHLRKSKNEASVLISRGCPFDCSFCSNPVWKSAKPWLRYRSIDNIITELDQLYDKGVREVYFSSDEINFQEKFAIDLCSAIVARDYKGMHFQCNMRADKVSSELVDIMKKACFWMVHLGIESGNNRVLKGLGKHITVEQVRKATRLLSSQDINVFAFMMLYNVWEEDGILQFESTVEVRNSIKFCMEQYREGYISYMSWQFCTPMPGSRLYDIAKRHNLFTDKPEDIMERFDEHYVSMNLPGISTSEMKRQNRFGILLKDWYLLRSGSVNWRHLWRIKENISALLR